MVAKNPDQAGLMKSRVRSWVEQIQKGSPDSNPKPREARRLRTEFCESSARQRFHRHKTTTRSSIAKRILKTLHAPARPPGRNHEMVVDHDRHSPDVSRQRGHPAKITRRSSITNRILKTLEAPAPLPTEYHPARYSPKTTRGSSKTNRIPRKLHGASPGMRAAPRSLTAPQRERFDMHETLRGLAAIGCAEHTPALEMREIIRETGRRWWPV